MTAPVVTVESDIHVWAIERNSLCYRRPRPTPAVLRWQARDPWAVQLDFTRDHRTWTFGWELLSAAIAGPAGDGDIRFRPIRAYVEIRFATRGGTATLAADRWDLEAFAAAVAPRQAAAAGAALGVPPTAHALLALIDASRRG